MMVHSIIERTTEQVQFLIKLSGSQLLVIRIILVAAAIVAQAPWHVWIALQLAILVEFPEQSRETSIRQRLKLNVTTIFASCLLAIGFWIGLHSSDSKMHQLGVVLFLVGIGGALRWFPVPIGTGHGVSEKRRLAGQDRTFALVLLAALLIFRVVHAGHWNETELAILAVVSLFSLAMCGIRLTGDLSDAQRSRLTMLTLLSHANVATVLMGWEQLNPERVWSSTSNLPTGKELFLIILLVESTMTVLNLFCRDAIRNARSMPSQLTPLRTKMLSCGFCFSTLSLAAVPPFPGAWWRFLLFSSLLLPHQRSIVTHLTEPHHGMIALSIAYLATSLIVMLGHLTAYANQVANRLSHEQNQEQLNCVES